MSTKPTPTKVVTGKVRLLFPALFQPRAMDDSQEPKYSVCLLIPKTDTETVNKIKQAVETVKQANASIWGGKIPAGLKVPLRDGDTERDSDEYKGHWFINAMSKQKPGVVDANVQPILDANEIYSGVYGRVSLNFYAYNMNGNRGVGAGLQNVQKVADGTPLSGRSRAEDDFTSVEEDFLA